MLVISLKFKFSNITNKQATNCTFMEIKIGTNLIMAFITYFELILGTYYNTLI